MEQNVKLQERKFSYSPGIAIDSSNFRKRDLQRVYRERSGHSTPGYWRCSKTLMILKIGIYKAKTSYQNHTGWVCACVNIKNGDSLA